MCLYIDDPVLVLSGGWPQARKPHRCYECGRTIDPGERYHRQSFVFEGDFDEVKTCAHCIATIDLGVALTGCPRAWYYGGVFADDLDGFVANIIDDEGHSLPYRDRLRMLRCVAAARRKWRWSDGTLMDLPVVPDAETAKP